MANMLILVMLIAVVTITTATLPPIGRLNMGNLQQQPVQSFFSNTRPGGGSGAVLKLMVGNDNNYLVGPTNSAAKGSLFDKPIVLEPHSITDILRKPIVVENPLIKPYNPNVELQKSLKQVDETQKKLSAVNQQSMNLISTHPVIVPQIAVNHPIVIHPIIPDIPDTQPQLVPNTMTISVPDQLPTSNEEGECSMCTLKGAYHGAKHVVTHPSDVGKPAGIINKSVSKAFVAGEIVGGAVAGAYYGAKGIDVEKLLKDK
jgi:hypothetical protein